MKQLSIDLFGSFKACIDGREITEFKSQRVRALLAYLVAEADLAHSRDTLASLLWSDWPDQEARSNFRYALYNLRQSIQDQVDSPYLLISRDTVQFQSESNCTSDVLSFNRLLREGQKHPTNPELLKEAISLHKGEFLEGFDSPHSLEFDEWVTQKREEYHRLLIQALEVLADYYESSGDYLQALVYAQHLIGEEPWQEKGHRQVIRLLALTGERGAALLHFQSYSQQLEKELGVKPDEETQKLIRLIQEDSRKLEMQITSSISPMPRVIGECPYRGLSAFREQDAPFYFGRADYVELLQQALEEHLLLVVLVGSSGSGKSSLIYAGLIPQLKGQKGWLLADFRPGQHPFHSLAKALIPWLEPNRSETERLMEAQKLADAFYRQDISIADVIERILEKYPDVKRFLLFSDQFEELYTLCLDEITQRRFIDTLLQTPKIEAVKRNTPARILLNMRADFMGRALNYRPFANVLQAASQMLGPMDAAELRTAVEAPAEKQGAVFEEGLVDRILGDIGDQPGNLPLLEFTLTLLWDEAVNGVLTHAAYEKMGRVEGALTGYAEQVFAKLNAGEQAAAKKIFMQLVLPGMGTEDTRRIASRADIGEENWPLVQYLADKRLVVTDQSTDGTEVTEVIHEALIQHWHRLKDWIEADRAFRTWQESLRTNIRQWEAANRDDSGLLRGVPLAQAENWQTERKDELSELENQYIQNSLLERQRQEQERQQEQKRELEKARAMAKSEQRARRILGALAAVLVIAVVVTVILTLFAESQRRQALTAYSLSLIANAEQAVTDADSGTALILALAANRIDNPPLQAQRALLNIAYLPGARSRESIQTLFPEVVGPATCLRISPDGQKILFGFEDGKLVLWNPGTKKYQVLSGHTGRVNAIAISPDGSTALSGGSDHQVMYWDMHTGTQIGHWGAAEGGHTGMVRTIDFNPDGKMAVSGGLAGESIINPGELFLWDLASGEVIRRFKGHANGVVAAAFTPDGREILASSGDPESVIYTKTGQEVTASYELLLWDAANGEIKARYPEVSHDVYALAISPDGESALLGSYYDHIITLLELKTGKKVSTLSGHQNAVRAVAFLTGGQQALSAGDDNRLILWNLATGKPQVIFKAGESSQLALAIQPDGRSALSITRRGDIFSWDLQDAYVLKRFGRHNDAIMDVDYTPDGRGALTCSAAAEVGTSSQDASLRFWDVASGRLLLTIIPRVSAIFQCSISPDGRWALSASSDGILRLFDLESGAEVRQFKGYTDWVISIAFSPDGKKALAGSKDGTLIYWDLENGSPIYKWFIGQNYNWSVAISPDGRTALSDGGQAGAIYWDLEKGVEIRRLVRNDALQTAAPGASAVAYLPDGQMAVTGENDGYVILWDLATGKEMRRYGRHDGIRTRVEVSRDGKTLLTSGYNGVLRLWDIESGELIREFGYTGPAVVFDIKMSPDGLTAISGSIDQTITQWSLMRPNMKDLTAWIGENRYVREPTCEERAMYQIEPLCAAH